MEVPALRGGRVKRIHKERDRLLRRLGRITGLVGAGAVLVCLMLPGVATPVELAIGSVLSIAVAAFAGLHSSRGACFRPSASSPARSP